MQQARVSRRAILTAALGAGGAAALGAASARPAAARQSPDGAGTATSGPRADNQTDDTDSYSRSNDRFVAYAQTDNYGRAYSNSADGGDLGWNEYFILDGYVSQYEVSHGTAYLDRIVEHVDRMISNAADPNGTGYLSWLDTRYAHLQLKNRNFAIEGAPTTVTNLISNPGFESGDDLPTDWTATGDVSGASRSVGAGLSFTGAAGATIRSLGSDESWLTQTVSTVAGRRYVLEFFGSIDLGSSQGVVEVQDSATGARLAIARVHHVGFERFVVNFTAPASGAVTIRLGLALYDQAGWAAHFDDISLRLLDPTAPAGQAATDAAAWRRIGTPLSNARRTDDSAAKTTQAWVLELIADQSAEPRVAQEVLNYAPDVAYGLQVIWRGRGLRVHVVDHTTGDVLVSQDCESADFVTTLIDFRTPTAGHDLAVEFSLPSAAMDNHASIADAIVAQRWAQMVHESNVMAPALRFALIVMADPGLAAYQERAETYTRFVADNLVHKWDPCWRQITGVDGADSGSGTYVFPDGNATEWFPGRSLPYNQMLSYGRLLYLLHAATDGMGDYTAERQTYLSRANDMNRALKANVRPHPKNVERDTDAYIWRYWDKLGPWDDGHYHLTDGSYLNYTSEDRNHGATTILGVTASFVHGDVWAAQDKRRFANTFVKVMWDPANPELLATNVGGLAFSGGSQVVWLTLADFDPRVVDIATVIDRAGKLSPIAAGWYPRYYRDKVVNDRFGWSDTDGDDLPAYWERIAGSARSLRVSSRFATQGGTALEIFGPSGGCTGVEQRLLDYQPNAQYALSIRAHAVGSGSATAELYDATHATVLGAVAVSTQESTLSSTTIPATPPAGADLRVRVLGTGSVVVEEVRALPDLAYSSEIPNGGFETLAVGAGGPPRYWTLGPGTSGSNIAHVSSDAAQGNRCVQLSLPAGAGPQRITYPWQGYRPSSAYSLSFRGKTSGTIGAQPTSAVVSIVDANTGLHLADVAFDSAQWEHKEALLQTPAEFDHRLAVLIQISGAMPVEARAWIDSVFVIPIP